MTTFYLIRHCQAEGQAPDVPLTDLGKAQAAQLVETLKNEHIDVVVSSPYKRAIDTTLPFTNHRELNIQQDERLKEGVLTPSLIDNWLTELEKTFLDLHFKLPGGESSQEAMERALAVVQDWHKKGHTGVALVMHGNLMALLLQAFHPSFGFEAWKRLQSPDVYKLSLMKDEVFIEHLTKTK